MILKRQKCPCDNKKGNNASDLKKKACGWEWHRLFHFTQAMQISTQQKNSRSKMAQVVRI